jgi:hypothetical protein
MLRRANSAQVLESLPEFIRYSNDGHSNHRPYRHPSQRSRILGTLIGTYPTMEAAFDANATFQSQNATPYIRTKIVTLKETLDAGTQVEPKNLFAEG